MKTEAKMCEEKFQIYLQPSLPVLYIDCTPFETKLRNIICTLQQIYLFIDSEQITRLA